jgi:hypothetical protein
MAQATQLLQVMAAVQHYSHLMPVVISPVNRPVGNTGDMMDPTHTIQLCTKSAQLPQHQEGKVFRERPCTSPACTQVGQRLDVRVPSAHYRDSIRGNLFPDSLMRATLWKRNDQQPPAIQIPATLLEGQTVAGTSNPM